MTPLIRRLAVSTGLMAGGTPHKPAPPPTPHLSADDADALLAIDADIREPAPEWVEFVGEAVSTWLVEHKAPVGRLDEEKTRWLLDRVDRDGHVRSATALVLLQRCCIKAQEVTTELRLYLGVQEARQREAGG